MIIEECDGGATLPLPHAEVSPEKVRVREAAVDGEERMCMEGVGEKVSYGVEDKLPNKMEVTEAAKGGDGVPAACEPVAVGVAAPGPREEDKVEDMVGKKGEGEPPPKGVLDGRPGVSVESRCVRDGIAGEGEEAPISEEVGAPVILPPLTSMPLLALPTTLAVGE